MLNDNDMLNILDDKVDFLQISCNVRTLNGVKHVATFSYMKDGKAAIGSVDGWTLSDVLTRTLHFLEQVNGETNDQG